MRDMSGAGSGKIRLLLSDEAAHHTAFIHLRTPGRKGKSYGAAATQPPPAAAVPDGLPAVERRVYECIAASSAGLVLDEIAAALKLPPSQLMPILSDLEIQEYIRSAEGGKYLKV